MVSCVEDPATGELVIRLNSWDVAQVKRLAIGGGWAAQHLDLYVVAIVEASIRREEARLKGKGGRR